MRVKIRYIGTENKNEIIEEIVNQIALKWEMKSFKSAVEWLVKVYNNLKFIDEVIIDEKKEIIKIRAGKSMFIIEKDKLSHK
jgi:hypothetical protein